ncbi:MAG: hypothetical protein EBR02_09720, partial [Alphaproteobacteria bacterium]|nr:hypothetical protein [Alphaproteobacteria bacterium]
MKLKIACIQINTGSDVAANIACVETLIVQAAGQGAELVALPENVFLMRDSAQKGDFEKYTQDNHPGVLAMQRLAKQQKIWILVGSIHCHASEGWHPRQSNAQAINVDCSAPFGSGLRRDD